MEKKIVLGLDIGGANIKAALVEFDNSQIKNSWSQIEYFPFWEKNLKKIPNAFKKIVLKLTQRSNLDFNSVNNIAITITAELSDAFQTKREGIYTILDALGKVFEPNKMYFISTNNEFLTIDQAKKNYLAIAAANWVSTALFLGKFLSQCILIDAGSTTIDLVPILDSVPLTKGKTDVERMLNHELIYTGGLRATIPSITHFVPYKGNNIRISFEKFALISDVHRILNNISEQEYLNDTADNRTKSIDDCYARLSRIICADIETITKMDLDQIAKFIYKKQFDIISFEIELFMKELIIRLPEFEKNPQFVITGLSAEFLIKKSLLNLGYKNILSYHRVTNIPDNISSSAFAIAGALHFQL